MLVCQCYSKWTCLVFSSTLVQFMNLNGIKHIGSPLYTQSPMGWLRGLFKPSNRPWRPVREKERHSTKDCPSSCLVIKHITSGYHKDFPKWAFPWKNSSIKTWFAQAKLPVSCCLEAGWSKDPSWSAFETFWVHSRTNSDCPGFPPKH